jgi:hypothetical protein
VPDQPADVQDKPQISSKLSVSFPENKEFQLHTAAFGESIDKQIENWLHETIRVWKESYTVLFEQKVPRWREIILGKPKDREKSFPWPNASNLVIQVCGQRVDDIAARVMGLVWSTSPVSLFRYFYKSGDPERDQKKKQVLEQFIDNVAYEPKELDLYRKENVWFSQSAGLGTAFVKAYPDKRVDVSVVGYDDKTKRTELETSETYNGPAVDNLKFEQVLGDPQAPTWEKSRLKCHIRTLSRHELQERAFSGFYDKDKVKEILNKPDRHGPDLQTQRTQIKKGITTGQDAILAEWDCYECWFWWFVTVRSKDGGKPQKVKVELTWSYHYKSRTVLRQVFNFMPDNEVPIIPTKLSISDEGIHGRGYADMLENFQEEVSTTHNQRIDARTIGIIGCIRTDNTNLDKNFGIYPGCILPGTKDQTEWIQAREPGDGGLQDEELTLRLADERAGVGPAVAGMGAGAVGKNKQFGSMGTLAVMQDGNTRVNHRVSDFRHSHVKLVSLCTAMYGKFGTGERGSFFGLDDHLLKEALEDYLGHKVRIPIRAATASANKEVSKQNDLLLRNALAQFNVEQVKVIQAITSQSDPHVKKYLMDIVRSQDAMMKMTLRDFGYDNPDEFVPKMVFAEEQNAQKPQGQAGNGQPPASALGVAPPPQQSDVGGSTNGNAGIPAIAQGSIEPQSGQR